MLTELVQKKSVRDYRAKYQQEWKYNKQNKKSGNYCHMIYYNMFTNLA